MKTYAIFLEDCEIHIELIEGSHSSIEYIKDDIKEHLCAFPDSNSGYCEQYPFYMAEWEIVGGRLPIDFDRSTILEINLQGV